MENPYQTLGLPEDASLTQIKEQYRELSKVIHPDKQQRECYNISLETFEKIDSAYRIIGNEFNKLVYDNFGIAGVQLVLANKQEFKYLEWEFQQGKNIMNDLSKHLTRIKIQDQEYNSYQVLKEYQCEANLQNTPICTINKIQSNTVAYSQQTIELPRWQMFELSLKSEFAMYRDQEEGLKGIMRHYFITQFGFNFPFLKMCSIEIQTQVGTLFSLESIQIKKKLPFGEAILNITNNGTNLVPQFITAIGRSGQSIQVALGFESQMFLIDKQLTERLNLQFQIQKQVQTLALNFTMVQDQNYQSTIRLSLLKTKAKSLGILTSEFKTTHQHLSFNLKTTIGTDGYTSVTFQFTKVNSNLRLPFRFKIENFTQILFWFTVPQIFPFIWKRGWINPFKKIKEKKRQIQSQKIDEYQKYNLETRISIEQGDQYQQCLEYEHQINGLIIISAYAGELDDIEQLIKENIANKFLVNITAQLQAEVIDGGLLIPAQSLDKLDGFFKAQSKRNSSYYWGFIKYTFNGKVNQQKWNWNDPFSIGNVSKQNKSSLIESILKYLYK